MQVVRRIWRERMKVISLMLERDMYRAEDNSDSMLIAGTIVIIKATIAWDSNTFAVLDTTWKIPLM